MNKFSVSASNGLCNCRIKFYPDDKGNLYPVEKMVSSKKIFNPLGLESCKDKGFVCSYVDDDCSETPLEFQKQSSINNEENIQRSYRRAKSKLYDLIRCNPDLGYFCTLTFDATKVQREDYNAVVDKFSMWCDNRVRRNGLKYASVIERHKESNGLHFHLVMNGAIPFVDSGTVKVPGRKRPIKRATAKRLHIPEKDWKTVYNIPGWSYGFSTAIEITGDPLRIKISKYLQKYLVKDGEKVGGRWYYSGGSLARPVFRFCDCDFYTTDFTYEINVPGNNIRVFCVPAPTETSEK